MTILLAQQPCALDSNEVITLILEDMRARGELLPTGRGVTVSKEPKISSEVRKLVIVR
jgi:hypothetical protein